MQFHPISRKTLLSLLLACSAWGSAHAELVTDGGFENGDLDAWTVAHAGSGSMLQVNMAAPHSGDFAVNFFAKNGQEDRISQGLATTAGTGYTLSFWLQSEDAGDGAFNVYLNDTLIADASSFPFSFNYFDFKIDFFGSAGGDVLSFGAFTANGFFDLDDISVVENGQFQQTQPGTVPEPAGLALVGIALGAAGLLSRRRSKPAA